MDLIRKKSSLPARAEAPGTPGGELFNKLQDYFNLDVDSLDPGLRLNLYGISIATVPSAVIWGDALIYTNAHFAKNFDSGSGNDKKTLSGIFGDSWSIVKNLIDQVKLTGDPVLQKEFCLNRGGIAKLRHRSYTLTISPILPSERNMPIPGVLLSCHENADNLADGLQQQAGDKNFEHIIRQSPVGVLLLRSEEMVVEVINDACAILFGHTPSDLINHPLFDIVPEAAEAFKNIIKTVLLTGKSFSLYEHRYTVFIDGQKKPGFANMIFQPYGHRGGRQPGVMVVCYDVTDLVGAARRLTNSEKKFRDVIAKAPVSMALFVGREMIIEEPNGAFIDLLGKGSEIRGKKLKDVVPELETENPSFLKILDQVFVSGKVHQTSETQVKIVKNGALTSNYYDFTYTPLFDESGEVHSILEIAVDVTDRVKAKMKIQESEKNLRRIILQAPVAMCILKGPFFIVEIANEQMYELWGLKADQLQGKPIFDILPHARKDGFGASLKSVFETGEAVHAYEVPVLLPGNGVIETKFVDFVYEAFRNDDQQIEGVMAVAIDVSEQVKARLEIQSAEAKARVAIESAGLGTYELDLASEEVWTSERFNEIWGVNDKLPRNALASLIHPDDLQHREQAHRDALVSGNLHYEARLIKKNGFYQWVRVKGKVIYDEFSKPRKLVGVIQDITEQKNFTEELSRQVQERTEELQALNEEIVATNEELSEANVDLIRANTELEQFAYVASHDLQEPLRKIQLFSNIITQRHSGEIGEATLSYIHKISNSANRMSYLIRDLLDYARLSANNDLVTSVDLNEILQSVLIDFEVVIQQKQAIVKAEQLPVIEAIRLQMNQLFYNLISNSLKFGKKGQKLELSITSEPLSQDELKLYPSLRSTNHYVRLVFADNGIGFSQQYAEQIFTVFQRLNDKSLYGGYGIGLALCRKVVENHGGIIHASGIENLGATFYVILPLNRH